MTDVDTLLDELAGRWARGEPLGVDELLSRAGERADELAPLIDAFLERAPRRAPSEDAMAYVRAFADPPLLRLRLAHEPALRVDDVADAITTACDVDPERGGKVRRYYQMLEAGTLDPAPVAEKLWSALAAVFGRPVRDLVRASSTGPPATSGAYYYRGAPEGGIDLSATHAAPLKPADEVDRLFGLD